MTTEKFQGKKFRPTGCQERKLKFDEWNHAYITYVDTFMPTRKYKTYLEKKRLAEYEERVRIVKQRLDYQYKMYGEVDEVDYSEFKWLIEQGKKYY